MSPDSEEKTAKLKEMHDADPTVFNKPEVKEWMGENQLGLDQERQALIDTGFDPQTSDMSGIVATATGAGRISLDRVSDMESTHSGAGNERAINAQKSSLSAERINAGETQRVDDFAAAGSGGRDFATVSYTDKDGVSHTAQVERLNTPNGDHGEFAMILDDGQAPVINAPKDMTAHDVASMVNGTANEEVQAAFENYHADGPGIIHAQAATNVDSDKGGAVLCGTAFENSPNTVASISDATGNNGISLSRISRETASGEGDVWSAAKDGVEIGRVTVEKDTGAAEVASRVMHDNRGDFEAIRTASGLSDNNPCVAFSDSGTPSGPEPMHRDIEPNAPGRRTNGSSWQNIGEVGFESDSEGRDQVSISYSAQGEHGMFIPTSAKIADTGIDVYSAVPSAPTGDGMFETVASGRVFEVSGEGVNGGDVKIVVDKTATVEDITAAVLAGGDAAANIKGASDIREAMGVSATMNAGSANSLKDFFVASRKKSRFNSKNNPVDAE